MGRGEAIAAEGEAVNDPSAGLYGEESEFDIDYGELQEDPQPPKVEEQPKPKAEKPKAKAERVSRTYVVLQKIESERNDVVWLEAGEVEAMSVEQAIRQYVGKNEDREGVTLLAIPVRSYRPLTVKVQTRRSVVVE